MYGAPPLWWLVAALVAALAAPFPRPGVRSGKNLLLYNHLFNLPQIQAGLPLLGALNNNHNNNNNNNNNNGNRKPHNEEPTLDNYICVTPEGTTGVCYTKEDCRDVGGTSRNSCDNGQGVCCVVEKTCRNVTTHPVTYFVNPAHPNPDTSASFCDFRIDVTNENVCQLRLDLEHFSLSGPHRALGICRNERLLVMTTLPNGIGLKELCGENRGQHFYIPVDATAVGSASVSLMIMTSGLKPYHWRMRITQIDCMSSSELIAPPGCLQYYTDTKGVIESFNYANGEGQYQSNMDYAICIKRSPNTCRVVYSQTDPGSFKVSSAEGFELVEGVGRAGTSSCDLTTHDYLHLPGGRYDGPAPSEKSSEEDFEEDIEMGSFEDDQSVSTADKFCGKSLSGLAVTEEVERLRMGYMLEPMDNITYASAVTSYASGPIVIRFHSDTISDPELEMGWRIAYHQLATGCTRSLK